MRPREGRSRSRSTWTTWAGSMEIIRDERGVRLAREIED
jgi:hypothetical protein